MNSIMREMPVLISVNMDKEEVGLTFENYNLVSAGVVNKENKLVGMITADDVVTVVQEEAEEDALRLAGVGDEEITDSVMLKTKKIQLVVVKFIYCFACHLGYKFLWCFNRTDGCFSFSYANSSFYGG